MSLKNHEPGLPKINVLQLCHNSKAPFVPICKMYLNSFDPEKYTVHTMFLRDAHKPEHVQTLAGSSVHFLNLGDQALKGLKLKAIATVLRFCRDNDIHMIIAHRYKAIYIAGLIGLRMKDIKVWGVVHTQNVFVQKTRQWLLRFICKKLNLVGASESVANNVAFSCPQLAQQNRISSLPNCLDVSLQNQFLSPEKARSTLKLKESDFVFACIGRLVDVKGHDVLLHAFAKQQFPAECKLVIIGAGPNLAKLESLALKLKINHQLVLTGEIPHAAQLLPAFDCFVFPSYEGEAFGLALLEAMLARVAIICSDASGPKEAVGEHALIFQQGNSEDLAARLAQVYAMGASKKRTMTEQAYLRWETLYSSEAFNKRAAQLFVFRKVS